MIEYNAYFGERLAELAALDGDAGLLRTQREAHKSDLPPSLLPQSLSLAQPAELSCAPARARAHPSTVHARDHFLPDSAGLLPFARLRVVACMGRR